MAPRTEPVIVRTQEHHLRQVFALIDRENWGWEFAEIRLIHRLDPGSSVVALDGGEVVGLVTCVDFGTHAFIVHVIVKDGWRGRGLGVRMMDSVLAELDSRGVAAVELHANPEAVRFYDQFSFRSLEEISYLTKSPPHPHPGPASDRPGFSFLPRAVPSSSVAGPLSRVTGYGVADLENGLTRLPADQALVRTEGGRTTAVLLSRTGEEVNGMGPWVMDDPTETEAEAMMRTMFSSVPSKRIDVLSPGSNRAAMTAMEACGFTVARAGIVRVVRSSRPIGPYPGSVLAIGHLGLI